jgi:hypothetical protein
MPTQNDFRVEPDGSNDSGHCDCCGGTSRTIWGYVYRRGDAHAAYFAHWTIGEVDRHGAHFDLILGDWGSETSAADRYAVSLAYRSTENGSGFMVIDANDRDVARSDLARRALRRGEVVGTKIADDAFRVIDALWLHDDRLAEIRGDTEGKTYSD